MDIALAVILCLMIVVAAADVFVSITAKKKIIIIPVRTAGDIKELLSEEIRDIHYISCIFIVNMGMEAAEFEKISRVCEKNKNIFCIDKNDILTFL